MTNYNVMTKACFLEAGLLVQEENTMGVRGISSPADVETSADTQQSEDNLGKTLPESRGIN